ncbi:MAG: N-acetylmuramoyl-L-alanine amidase [Clostridiaceae bacterium]
MKNIIAGRNLRNSNIRYRHNINSICSIHGVNSTPLKNKLITGIVLSGILLILFGSGFSMAAAISFTDIQDHWAQADISRAVDAGYIKGYTDSTFRPDNTVSRAEYITMLNAAFAVPMDGTDSGFKDVKSVDWFARDVWSAAKAGYTDIFTGDMFSPNQPLTRQEAAVLTADLAEIVSEDNVPFKDEDQIADWALPQLNALASVGILNGHPDGYFRPSGNITRAQATAIINRTKIYEGSVQLQASLTVTGSVVNIRSGPDTAYSVVTKVSRGNILTACLHSSNNWYKVMADGLNGWITGDYVKADESDGRGEHTDRGGNSGRTDGAGNVNKGENTGNTDNTGNMNNTDDTESAESTAGNGNEPDPGSSNESAGGAGSTGSTGSTGSIGGSAGTGNSENTDNSTDNANSTEKNKLIVVDAGHGGKDDGATGLNGTKEKDINLAIALKLSEYLGNTGYNVLMTRSDDAFISLKERSLLSDAANADVFVSIHCDVSQYHNAGGTCVFTEPASGNPVYEQQEDSKRLAGLVLNELANILCIKNRGIREQDLSVCRETNTPAILIETAFIDNENEEKLLNDPSFREKAAIAIKLGIDSYFTD